MKIYKITDKKIEIAGKRKDENNQPKEE